MEEGKVIISLENYNKLIVDRIEAEKREEKLIELIFNNVELTSNKQELKFDYYNSKMMCYLKNNYKNKYDEHFNFLISEGDD